MYYNNKTEIETALKFLKCFKCGTYNNLISYPIHQISKLKSLKNDKVQFKNAITELYIPICLKCSLEFQRWNQLNKKYKMKNFELFLYLSLSFILMWVLVGSFWFNLFIFIIMGVIFMKFNFQSLKYLRSMEFYPKRYIKYSKEQILYIKSDTSIIWYPFLQWIRDTLYEEYFKERNRNFNIINKK